jgi:hypothetical protein
MKSQGHKLCRHGLFRGLCLVYIIQISGPQDSGHSPRVLSYSCSITLYSFKFSTRANLVPVLARATKFSGTGWDDTMVCIVLNLVLDLVLKKICYILVVDRLYTIYTYTKSAVFVEERSMDG